MAHEDGLIPDGSSFTMGGHSVRSPEIGTQYSLMADSLRPADDGSSTINLSPTITEERSILQPRVALPGAVASSEIESASQYCSLATALQYPDRITEQHIAYLTHIASSPLPLTICCDGVFSRLILSALRSMLSGNMDYKVARSMTNALVIMARQPHVAAIISIAMTFVQVNSDDDAVDYGCHSFLAELSVRLPQMKSEFADRVLDLVVLSIPSLPQLMLTPALTRTFASLFMATLQPLLDHEMTPELGPSALCACATCAMLLSVAPGIVSSQVLAPLSSSMDRLCESTAECSSLQVRGASVTSRTLILLLSLFPPPGVTPVIGADQLCAAIADVLAQLHALGTSVPDEDVICIPSLVVALALRALTARPDLLRVEERAFQAQLVPAARDAVAVARAQLHGLAPATYADVVAQTGRFFRVAPPAPVPQPPGTWLSSLTIARSQLSVALALTQLLSEAHALRQLAEIANDSAAVADMLFAACAPFIYGGSECVAALHELSLLALRIWIVAVDNNSTYRAQVRDQYPSIAALLSLGALHVVRVCNSDESLVAPTQDFHRGSPLPLILLGNRVIRLRLAEWASALAELSGFTAAYKPGAVTLSAGVFQEMGRDNTAANMTRLPTIEADLLLPALSDTSLNSATRMDCAASADPCLVQRRLGQGDVSWLFFQLIALNGSRFSESAIILSAYAAARLQNTDSRATDTASTESRQAKLAAEHLLRRSPAIVGHAVACPSVGQATRSGLIHCMSIYMKTYQSSPQGANDFRRLVTETGIQLAAVLQQLERLADLVYAVTPAETPAPDQTDKLSVRIENLERELECERQRADELARAESTARQQANEQLSGDLDALRRENAELEAVVKRLTAEAQDRSHQLEENQSRLSQLDQLEQERTRLAEKELELTAQLQAERQTSTTLKSKNTQLQKQLTEARRKLTEIERQGTTFKEQLAVKCSEVSRLEARVGSFDSVLGRLHDIIENYREEHAGSARPPSSGPLLPTPAGITPTPQDD